MLVVVVSVALLGSMGKPPVSPSYTINGLTCPLDSGNVLGRLSNDSRIIPTVEQDIQSPKFLSGAKGMPYGFYYASIDEVGPGIDNGTIIQPHTVLDLGFGTSGANTPCLPYGKFLNWLDVQVPLSNGTFDVAAAAVHSLGGSK